MDNITKNEFEQNILKIVHEFVKDKNVSTRDIIYMWISYLSGIPLEQSYANLCICTDNTQNTTQNTTNTPTKYTIDSDNSNYEQYKCKICLENLFSVVFLPCSHGACHECAYTLDVCHICRQNIDKTICVILPITL